MPTRRGFTIIELLIVISILVLLLAITFPVYASIRRSQRIKRVAAAVIAISGAAHNYQNDFGVYPMAQPPSAIVPAGPNLGNRALVHFLKLGEAAGARSSPYLPSPFYDDAREIKGSVLLDEWERPFIYFDTSAMKAGTSRDYDILGNRLVRPVRGTRGYYNFGGCQVWSVGPNERNDAGRNLHSKAADDLANFIVED